MKPYPAYKDSGVEWLGNVPEHWELKRLKFAAVINPSKSELSGLPGTLEVSFYPMELIGFGYLNDGQEKTLEDVGSGFTYFRDDDVLVAKITPSFENGKGALATGLKNKIGFGTTEIHVIRPQKNLSKIFLYYLTYSHPFRKIGEGLMEGTAGQKRVPNDFLIDYPLPLPPLAEQTAIAAYLDRKTAQIDTLIARKHRLIDLLQEERIAAISHAVTKGIPNWNEDWSSLQDCSNLTTPHLPRKMKDSGIEWIGDVPGTWEVKRIKYIAEVNQEALAEKTDPDYEFYYVDIGNVSLGKISDSIEKIKFENAPSRARRIVKKGDTIVSTVRTYLKAITIVDLDKENLIASTGFAVLSPREINKKYFAYLMTCEKIIDTICALSVGVSYPAVNASDVANIPIWYPIDEAEQTAIAAWLDRKTAHIDQTIDRTQRQIDLLQEYRTTLISAVVTGKVDVREE